MLRVIGCLTQEHDLRLVALAACVCVLACGTVSALMAYAQTVAKPKAVATCVIASVIFGCGVWSLHFVAMLAFRSDVPISYHIPLTLLSALLPVAGSALALNIWLLWRRRLIGVLAGGTLLGLSIGAMHYAGVMAMRLPGTLHFDPTLVVASLVASVGFAMLALARSTAAGSIWHRVEVILWLTLGICGLHFTGMAAVSIELGGPVASDEVVLGSAGLGIGVGLVSLGLLLAGMIGTVMEQRLSRQSTLELKRMRLLADLSREVLIIYRDGIIRLANSAGERLFGLPGEDLIGRPLLDLVAELDHPIILRRVNDDGIDLHYEEIRIHTATGAQIPVEFTCSRTNYEGKPSVMMAIHDLSDRKRDEERIRHLAHHDVLTDLPNRFLLGERLTRTIAAATRSDLKVAFMYIDLDHFKPVNDLLGHAAGDALLIKVAERLQSCIRSIDTLARIGGDEFVVVTTSERKAAIPGIAQRIIDAMAKPFDLDAGRAEISASVGIAIYPDDGDTPDALMHAADMALYIAKQEKRGTYRFFEASMNEQSLARQQLARDLHFAISRGQLQVHYQPLLNCRSGDVEGFEALLRWYHPEHGLVPPLEFISVAEEVGLIDKIGQWVLETACAVAVQWEEPLWVAVNVSPIQFRDRNLPQMVADVLARTGLPARRLEIELTESVLVRDTNGATTILSALRSMGVRLALDDFGTGYSSLSYLHAFKFDKLKIDRSFIALLGATDDATIIVRAIIGLAHNLHLNVVAEGVETPEQLAMIRELLCDQAQGFLLGRPMQMVTSTELITARTRQLFGEKGRMPALPEPALSDLAATGAVS